MLVSPLSAFKSKLHLTPWVLVWNQDTPCKIGMPFLMTVDWCHEKGCNDQRFRSCIFETGIIGSHFVCGCTTVRELFNMLSLKSLATWLMHQKQLGTSPHFESEKTSMAKLTNKNAWLVYGCSSCIVNFSFCSVHGYGRANAEHSPGCGCHQIPQRPHWNWCKTYHNFHCWCSKCNYEDGNWEHANHIGCQSSCSFTGDSRENCSQVCHTTESLLSSSFTRAWNLLYHRINCHFSFQKPKSAHLHCFCPQKITLFTLYHNPAETGSPRDIQHMYEVGLQYVCTLLLAPTRAWLEEYFLHYILGCHERSSPSKI